LTARFFTGAAMLLPHLQTVYAVLNNH
jgi:hypothetical protein